MHFVSTTKAWIVTSYVFRNFVRLSVGSHFLGQQTLQYGLSLVSAKAVVFASIIDIQQCT